MGADTMTHKGQPSGGGAMVMMALWGLLAILAITQFLRLKAILVLDSETASPVHVSVVHEHDEHEQ